MVRGNNRSRGFTLIAALLILVLLSGVAAGLLFITTNEVKMSGNGMQGDLAYYGAESGMEKLTADLANLYTSTMSPTDCQIYSLANSTNFPTQAMVGNITYTETITNYTDTADLDNCAAKPTTTWNQVSSGSNQGLYAELVPMTLIVSATRPGGATNNATAGASINITRNIEVALIPVFQFGVFCGFDCSYFAGPDFSFGGRVHTNGNLFLAEGDSDDLVFNDKVQAFKQIITDRLENGYLTTTNYTGTTYVPNASGGCPLNTFPPTGSNCIAFPSITTIPGDASWSGGYPTIGGAANPNFPTTVSTSKFDYYLANSLTGVTNMQLPFVTTPCTTNPPPCTDPISIIRKPLSGEVATSSLGSARLYNKAAIRILLADDPADLHPERGTAPIDGGDVQIPLTETTNSGPFTDACVALSAASGYSGKYECLGFGDVGEYGWVSPRLDGGPAGWANGTVFPLIGELTGKAALPGPLTGPWIRVEICTTPPCNSAGAFTPVTAEWLELGFTREFNTDPTSPGTNVDPNAILILQQLRPSLAQSATTVHCTALPCAAAYYNYFYPINFYDAREGEMRDASTLGNTTSGSDTYSSCSVNGIMNAVELDVGNLAKWLNGSFTTSPVTGTSATYSNENGYVLYFSDHRGMRKDPNQSNGTQTPAGVYSGESGIEDVVNASQPLTSSTPDGALEPATYYTYSPEDVDQNGKLDNWGENNIGYGFGIATNTAIPDPYLRINVANAGAATSVDCAAYASTAALPNPPVATSFLTGNTDEEGMANPVSGTRHVLKLVDGGMNAGGTASYLPQMPAASLCTQTATNSTGCGGFTVASENPVYVEGNYNSNAADPFWGTANNATPTQTPHSSASIVADIVSVLSNQWTDASSLVYPDTPGDRAPTASGYYRVAISGGKSIPFPQPTWTNVAQDFGTDGGMHNFLHYLESWGANGETVFYNGSLVSMYYSEYNTGTYKDGPGGSVYSPGTRKYYFDVLFLNPNNLPPATPEFQDIDSLSYHENFTPN
jgi:Tfp pilus assembly protein PilX